MDSENCNNHNFKITSICLNEDCNQRPFSCSKCLRENHHLNHSQDLKFTEFLEDEVMQDTELRSTIILLKNRIEHNSKIKTTLIDHFDSIINKDLETLREMERLFSEKSAQFSDLLKSLSQQNSASKSEILNFIQSIKSENIIETQKLSSHLSSCIFDLIEKLNEEKFFNVEKINFEKYNCSFTQDNAYCPAEPVPPSIFMPRDSLFPYNNEYSYLLSPYYEKEIIKFSIKAEIIPEVSTSCGIGIFKSLNINDIINSEGFFIDFYKNPFNSRLTPVPSINQFIDIELNMDSKEFNMKSRKHKSTTKLDGGKYQILILLGKGTKLPIKKIKVLY